MGSAQRCCRKTGVTSSGIRLLNPLLLHGSRRWSSESPAREEIQFGDLSWLKRGVAPDDAKVKGLEITPWTYCEVVMVIIEGVDGTFARLAAFITRKLSIGG